MKTRNSNIEHTFRPANFAEPASPAKPVFAAEKPKPSAWRTVLIIVLLWLGVSHQMLRIALDGGGHWMMVCVSAVQLVVVSVTVVRLRRWWTAWRAKYL